MAAPIQYTVKAGDTLNKIAVANGFSDYKTAGGNISGYDSANPDALAPGQVLTIGGAGGPTTKEVPGIGTLTITPKSIPTAPAADPGAVGDNAAGLYARTGVKAPTTPPPPGTANGYVPPAVAGLPSYPSATPSTPQSSITEAYKKLSDSIDEISTKIKSAATPSDQETKLQQELDAAKAKIQQFDVGTLQSEEDLRGQGRGATLGTIGTATTILDRTRALERLGFSTDADTIATQLSTAQNSRQSQGNLANTEYTLATKKLDIALGLQDKITTLNQTEQNNARQYLLDVVNFADGKTYAQLDPETQAAITHAVANSPITLDMVQIALKSGSDKAAAAAQGNLRSVPGVGVVQITQDTKGNITGYKVVVPENPADHTPPAANTPSFNEYLAAQKIPLPALTQDKMAAVRAEYDAKYSNVNVNLGKLTATNKNDLSQAGLSSAPSAVQSYFLNAPATFRDSYQRDLAAGKAKPAASLADIQAAYTTWYNANNKKSTGVSAQDLQSLFGQ